MSFTRAERVSGLIQKMLSDMLQKEISDPRLKFVTITGVKMSSDLRIASVYFAASGPDQNKNTVALGFKSAYGFIKKKLAKRLGLRYMPDIRFFNDDSFDYASRIESLLDSVNADE